MDRDRIMISNRGTKLPNKVSESLPSLQSPSSSSVSNRLTTHTSLDYSQQLSLVEEGKKRFVRRAADFYDIRSCVMLLTHCTSDPDRIPESGGSKIEKSEVRSFVLLSSFFSQKDRISKSMSIE